MKKLLVCVIAFSAAAIAAPALADSNGSIGYTRANIDDFSVDAVTLRGGANSGAFGVEGEASFGLGSDVVGSGASRAEAKLKSEFGIYGTAQADLSDNFTIIGRAGYGWVSSSVRNGALPSRSYSDSGVALGVGALWKIDDANGVRFDFTTAAGKPGHATDTPNSWTVSFVRAFQ